MQQLVRAHVALAALGCALWGGTAALAVTVELGAFSDSTIYEEDDRKSNGAGSYFFAGNNNASDTRRALISFNVSSIPSGSTINSVTLTLYMSRTQAGNVSVNLHRVLADWGEGSSNAGGQEGGGTTAALNDATWRYRFYNPADEPGSPQWSSLGGDFASGNSASTSVGGNGFYSWSSAGLANDVQGWVNAPSTNFGWIIRGGEAGAQLAKRFNSRQNTSTSQRPKLSVNYTPPPVTGACCSPGQTCQELTATSCANQGSSFQGEGSDCSPNPCPPDPTGACCKTDSPWTCSMGTQSACVSSGGNYQGDGGQCSVIDAEGGCPVILDPFEDPLPVPGTAQPVAGSPGGAATYHIVMQEVQQQLHNDLPPTTVWGYGTNLANPAGATYPGPKIEARTGLPVVVRYFNDLRDTSLGGNPPPLRTSHYLTVDTCLHGAMDQSPRVVPHLHGGHVESRFDGYPYASFLPGQEAIVEGSPGYHYPNDQQASMIWFHDHALGITRLNVYMGLAGLYVIRDTVEDALGLPSGPYEIPLVIQDRTFRATPLGQLAYHGDWVEHFFGDTVLVNGKVWPFLEVARGKYRFRLLNGSNSREYMLSLDRLDLPGGQDVTFQAIGTDGGLLPAPVTLNEIMLAPGERGDIIVDFAAIPPGTEILMTNSSVHADAPAVPNVMKFVVTSALGHAAPVPATLRPVEPIDPVTAVVRREFLLRKGTDACTGEAWEIKSRNSDGVEVGARFDDITEFPQLGSAEIWEFANPSVVPHPMHVHLILFQILNRQPFQLVDDQIVLTGPPEPPAPEEAGWKDTARAEPGKVLRVIARFTGYAGKYPYHCHILEHEDHEMMRQFWTVAPLELSLSATEISWPLAPGATGYDVVRGDLGTLRSTAGNFALATQACLLSGAPVLSASHVGVTPLPGQGIWFLTRRRDAVGKGTYDSGGSSQVGLRDEEIETSGFDCP